MMRRAVTAPNPYAEMHELVRAGLVRSWRYEPIGREVCVKVMLNPDHYTRDEAAYAAPDLSAALVGVLWWLDELAIEGDGDACDEQEVA